MNYEIDRYFVMPMNRDPINTDDITMGCHCGTRWINYATNRAFTCTDATASAAIWHQTTVPSSRYEIVSIPFATNSTTYETAHSIPYVGSNIAALRSVKVVASQNGGAADVTFDLRITDVTNNTIIAELVGNHSLTKSFFNVGVISNSPSTEAIFDIEVRRSGTITANNVILYSLIFEFL